MRRRLRSATLLALAGLISIAAFAAPVHAARPAAGDPLAPGLSGTQRLQALLDQIKAHQLGVKTLQARFVQRRQSAMLMAPEESNGIFSYAAPDRVRWEYLSPTPITVVIRGNEMTTWYRDLKRAERVNIGRASSQIFKVLGAGGSMETLLDYFNVSLELPKHRGDPYKLVLLPRYERIKKRLKSMTLTVDADTYSPTRVRYEETDGDTTEYEFHDVQPNASLPPDRFALQLPPGVQTRVLDLAHDDGAKSHSR